MHYLQNWAQEDFDIFEFVGQDSDPASGGASTNGDQYPTQDQFNDYNPEKDHMYSVLQYNDMICHDNNQQMYGHPLGDMPGNGFMQDNRYTNPSSGSILNNTVEKLRNQQIQQQPSTSRLSNVVNNTPTYPNRMRPNMVNSLAQPTQLNSADLSENVLLPSSSTSPQNNSMYLTQPIVKCEPATNYDMVGEEDYYNSTSDNESHYSSNGLALSQTGSNGKPRKYRIKPESERVNPQYRAKRAKNNDAVRRSREKAKHQQHEKERRLQFLESEHSEHYKLVNQLNQQVRDLKAENMSLRKNCNCGGIQQVFRR